MEEHFPDAIGYEEAVAQSPMFCAYRSGPVRGVEQRLQTVYPTLPAGANH